MVKLFYSSGVETVVPSNSTFSRSGPANLAREATDSDVLLDCANNKDSGSSRPGTRHQSGNVVYIPSSAMLQDVSGAAGPQSGGAGSIPTSNERGVSVRLCTHRV